MTIAGSDSSAGAGIQADLKTFAALGVYGVNAVTAIVAEAPGTVSAIQGIQSTVLSAQLERVISSFPISAIKIGMLATEKNVAAVTSFLADTNPVPSVLDPVLRASAGAELLDQDGVELLRNDLLPLVSLATPNLDEAAILLNRKIPDADIPNTARWLHEQYGCDFLVKGGHRLEADAEVTDYAFIGGEAVVFPHPRLEVSDTHGTGCTLSSAIAAFLAQGHSMEESIGSGIQYLTSILAVPLRWSLPRATEALNHFRDDVDSSQP